MEYHAIIDKTDGWWIGWLTDLPGVNAQERTRDELMESLEICAKDILDLKGMQDPDVDILILPEEDSGTSEYAHQEGILGA
jgi:predicted RNase H-like HicB family nuclease